MRLVRLMWAAWALWIAAVGVVHGTASSPHMAIIDNIPDGISDSCSQLLQELDQDKVFQQCTEPLIVATNTFAQQSTNSSRSVALSSSMEKLCQAQNGCDRHLVRYFLFEFWNQCTDELEARHPEILQLYEYLYIFNPFRDAVCSKDASGRYCLPTITKKAAKKSSKTKRAMPLPQDVYSEAYWARVLPTIPRSHMMAATNASSAPAINTSQLPSLAPQQVFFFLSGESDPDVLCTECSKHVLAAYISYELSSPYAPGLENSGVLKSQQSIYERAKSVCGRDFVSSINQQAHVQSFTGPASGAVSPRALTPHLWGWLVVAYLLST